MKSIFKYPVEMSENFTIEAPEGAQFHCVQLQHGQVQVWARVDTEKSLTVYRFGVHGTGHELNEFTESAPYVGTFQLAGGSLVFHLFGGISIKEQTK